jgi:hypothetical protein
MAKNLDDQAAAELAAAHDHVVEQQAVAQLTVALEHWYARRWHEEGRLDELIERSGKGGAAGVARAKKAWAKREVWSRAVEEDE